MKCQKCNLKEANVHVVKSINGIMQEIHLCEKCASEDTDMHEIAAGLAQSSMFNLGSLISGMFNSESIMKEKPSAFGIPGTVTACDVCGMTLSEYKRTGKLGCEACYEKFGGIIEPLLRRLHGSVVHKGRSPGKQAKEIKAEKEIERLKELLQKAINEEAYERAAEIRDEIRALESVKESVREEKLKRGNSRNSPRIRRDKNEDKFGKDGEK